MRKIYFVVDADGQIGYGHLKRCLALASILQGESTKIQFIIGGDEEGSNEVENAGYPNHRLKGIPGFREKKEFLLKINNPLDTLLIFDIAHHKLIECINDFKAFFLSITKAGFKTAFIDSFGIQSVRSRFIEFSGEILIAPYVGEIRNESLSFNKQLLGPEYFILDPAYLATKKKIVRGNATKVLVTTGGSDPKAITEKILKALVLINKDILEIMITIGPGFKKAYISSLFTLAKNALHKINFLENEKNLCNSMQWADVCISTSGLTKYELAATGTPAILISIDNFHDKVNSFFTSAGTSIDLGEAANVDPVSIKNALVSLLANRKLRQEMSNKGQNLINAGNSIKLAEEILE